MPKISLDLTGQWEFKQYPLSARRMRDLDEADWHSTSVPSSIFTSLIEAGKITQAAINTNPEEFSWVSEQPWVYRKIFDVQAEILDCNRIDLVFDGLDTIANIWLNDKLIGKTNNMFIPFRFDVTSLLKQQRNSLVVKFDPAEQYARKLMTRYTCFDESDFRNPHRVYIRKAQYQFGWDFCPPLPGCGIWRPVWLEGIKKARVADLHLQTIDCSQRHADIKIAVDLDAVAAEDFLCRLSLSGGGKIIEHNLNFKAGDSSQSAVIRIENPQLWWPAGYGSQHLYHVMLQLLSDHEVIDQTWKEFGIRTAKLNCSFGRNDRKFQFEINDRPVYTKGANWIPTSLFAQSATNEDYEKLLNAALKANMNMLRVWGGGYYEANEFYQLCDRLGIMVWQDFMFACAYYPDRKWFLNEVKAEADAVIRKLRNHPSIVLWCGNNEIEWMHNTGRLGKGKKFYGKDIYHKLLPQSVAELNPGADYIPTTPLYTQDNSHPRGISQQSSLKIAHPITSHQWDVWSQHQPVSGYLCAPEDIPPFVVEFGLQSLPPVKTIEEFCSADQLCVGSRIIEKHNYQSDGNGRLYRYLGDLFGATGELDRFVYLSQVTQARGVKAYVEHLRAHNFRNNGALFWQLNDCCPAISWSALDYTRQPKALYYYCRHFFSEFLVAVVPELQKVQALLSSKFNSISIVAVNDAQHPLSASLNCSLIDLSGHPIDKVTYPVAIGPFSASRKLKLPKAFNSPPKPYKSALHVVMEKDGNKIAENLFFYLPDKYIDWPEAKITPQFSQITDRQWLLKLKSNVIVRDVQISTTVPAEFSDNFINLVPPYDSEITLDFGRQISSVESVLRLRSP